MKTKCIDGREVFRKAHVTTHGYIQTSLGRRGAQVVGHRLVWQECFGSIPEGMFVCHHCDNRACVAPDHLFIGTPQDNTDDMVSKGRGIHGSRHPLSKLTAGDVEKIRTMPRKNQKEIAKQFGISQARVSKIQRREAWRNTQ